MRGSRFDFCRWRIPRHGSERREVALLTAVDHPTSCRCSVSWTCPALVLVLENAEGGSLDDLLAARGTLPAGEVVTACAPIAQALAELHARGLVHGQVTPANVLFSGDGRPMLGNFGTGPLSADARLNPPGWRRPKSWLATRHDRVPTSSA